MGDGDLFAVMDAPYFNPEKESSLEPAVCDECNEIVLKDFIKERKGKKVCIECESSPT
jgi:formylmethanofuran dehydrogenase subunit E